MSRLGVIANFVGHYKYLIVVVVGTALVGFLDDNSIMRRIQLGMQIADLEAEIAHYREINEAEAKQLRQLRANPKAIEKIARERYFMKSDDEDIFVLSDDEQQPDTENK
jgi:cell division protein DivIC